jgi:kynurenine formamidase
MIYDLTHTIMTGMPHFAGDPEPRIEERHATLPWRGSALYLGSHSGTHVDAPRHYLPDGRGMDAYPPARFIGPGMVVDARGFDDDQPIEAPVLDSLPLHAGSLVVLRTGWEHYWGHERYFRHPYLAGDLAVALVERGVTLLAIDALNVDSTTSGGADAHARLLGADVLIVENVCGLDMLTAGQPYIFAFMPLALGPIDGAPVRALAWDVDHSFA